MKISGISGSKIVQDRLWASHLSLVSFHADIMIHFLLLTIFTKKQVVLSQWGGTNRGGFNIVASNTKRDIHLDGLFNIISYDIVPKIQDMLMSSEFKVSWVP